MVSDIQNNFIKNFQTGYIPAENMTVDEQLFLSKTLFCSTYIANKPTKFETKFRLLLNVESKYLWGFQNLGKDSERLSNISLSERVVMVNWCILTSKKFETICGKIFFTSLKLAEKLRTDNTSIVGTMRRNIIQITVIPRTYVTGGTER